MKGNYFSTILNSLRNFMVTFLLAFFTLFSLPSFSQELHSSIREKDAQAIRVISTYASNMVSIDTLLEQAGYSVPPSGELTVHDWDNLPPVRQLEIAFRQASEYNHDSGEKLLALMAKALTQESIAANLNEILLHYTNKLDQGDYRSVTVHFAPLSPKNFNKVLNPEYIAAIKSISQYTHEGFLLVTLTSDFGLEDVQVSEVFSHAAGDTERLLTLGLQKAKQPPRSTDYLLRTIARLEDNFISASLDSQLKKIKNSLNTDAPSSKPCSKPCPALIKLLAPTINKSPLPAHS